MENKNGKGREIWIFFLLLIVGSCLWNISFKDEQSLLISGNIGLQIIAASVSIYWLKYTNAKLETMVVMRTEQLENQLDQMEYLAYHDTLTGLPNRRLFEMKLSEAIGRHQDGEQIILMLLDLDRFKYINDNLGHAYGDSLLKEVGARLNHCLDDSSLVGRIGGDEYTIFMEKSDLKNAEEVAKNMIHQLEKPYFINETELHITPSIGISVYPDYGKDSETLFTQADMAMYSVKEKGKNNYQVFDFSMYDRSRIYLENSLRHGIKNEEFILHYQPQISLETGEIIGVEALIRWNKPGEGLLPPKEFIPLAEETGLITKIGKWALETACKQIVEWIDRGMSPIKIAVNISSIQFQQDDFVDSISTVIQQTSINPELLELEITETLAIEDIEGTISKLAELKKMGIQISIDDFGTGYSSLHYLSQFQIDRLKIDRSFIHSIEQQGEKASAIVKLITLMAKGLNLKVLAEGVEQESQKQFLNDIECDEYQGYLFSKPIAGDEFERLFAS